MVPRVFVYGEDGLTLKYIKERLVEILVKLGDKSHPIECTVFYRPSFGRERFYGEFDAIIITPKTAYLVESKWDGSGGTSIKLEEHQIRRHKILKWYHNNWKGESGEGWDEFAKKNNPDFREEFTYFVEEDGKMVEKSKYIPSSSSILGQNLQTILKEVGDRKLKDVLLIFYKDEPFDVEQDGFATINIKYELTLGLYTKLE